MGRASYYALSPPRKPRIQSNDRRTTHERLTGLGFQLPTAEEEPATLNLPMSVTPHVWRSLETYPKSGEAQFSPQAADRLWISKEYAWPEVDWSRNGGSGLARMRIYMWWRLCT